MADAGKPVEKPAEDAATKLYEDPETKEMISKSECASHSNSATTNAQTDPYQ